MPGVNNFSIGLDKNHKIDSELNKGGRLKIRGLILFIVVFNVRVRIVPAGPVAGRIIKIGKFVFQIVFHPLDVTQGLFFFQLAIAAEQDDMGSGEQGPDQDNQRQNNKKQGFALQRMKSHTSSSPF